jgi:4-amino-4-deoxy-L-arabinose transferase-like glycosyltransferase
MPHYWFPALIEGMFVWSMAFGLDSTPQLIHFIFGLLTLSLIFYWTQSLFGSRAAWWSIAISLSMPSLPWLMAWAYTDLGLAFYSIGTLFALSNWKKESYPVHWLMLAGIFCGFAMGIKYTAFVLPVAGFLCIILWLRNNLKILLPTFLKFSGFALLSGEIWYIRNLIWMKNPVYPFAFGGVYWDSFRAEWYAGTGSGIGWDVMELILLPFVTTFGFRDENYFDGRMGPFYLVLTPLVLYSILRIYQKRTKLHDDMSSLVLFGFLSISVWAYGVIQTQHLMQSRLLFPALLALLPLFAKSILIIESWNIPKLNFRFIFSTIFAIAIFTFTLDFALLVFFRNPIMAAIGSESRTAYTERFNSGYAQLLSLTENTPQEAFIYLINEPRSYGINRAVQPDPINDNIAHDFYLYSTNEAVIVAWKQIGCSHVLFRSFIFEPTNENQHISARLHELRNMLIEVDATEEYILLEIP